MVDHKIPEEKLEQFEVRGITLKLLRSYLNNRQKSPILKTTSVNQFTQV